MVGDFLPNSEALEILENMQNGEIEVYVPRGHSFTVYSLDENLTIYLTVFGAALFTFAIVVILMNALGGDRYG